MPGFIAIVLIVSVVAYLLFAEFVARYTERRYQTDIDGADNNLLFDDSVSANSRSVEPESWKGWREMIVASIHDESPDCRSFKLQPSGGGPLPRFLGGQSILVRVPSDANDDQKPVSRCYSLSSGPGEDGYRITVKRAPGGRLSTQLHDSVSVGDVIEIQSPRGRFHMDCDEPNRPLHLIAAGIGITPMLSMLLHSLEETPTREVQLYYQLRSEENAPFLRALRYLSDSLAPSGSFGLHVWFSQPTDHEAIGNKEKVGRITPEQMTSTIASLDGDFRICGPSAFMESIAEGLINIGAAPSRVQYESFGGKAKGPGAIAISTDQPTSHRVTFLNSGREGVCNAAADTLLDVAEASAVSVDSSCRSGMCGSCVHRLLRGQVKYTEPPECEFAEDEVVLCVAHPTSDVEVDV
jgi:ferredoxin-NADP reductase